jgi:glycine oxidase
MDMQALQGAELRAVEPSLNPSIEQGWWLPDIGQMRNPRLVKAARASIAAAGVTIIEDREVTGLLDDGERITGVTSGAGDISAGQVIIAGGSWTAGLLGGLQPTLPITPVKGQMILYKAPPGLVGPMVLHHHHYLIPRRDGRVVAGSTLEQAGYDKTPTAAARDKLHATATALVPELANYPIEHHWAGLRPSSPGGIPYIGPHPQRQGLYVNSGHFRNGIIIGLASARLLADQILAREPILDPAPYALDAERPSGLY